MSLESREEKVATLNTASSVISYVSGIEQDSAAFYEERAGKIEELSALFSSFVKENKKHEKNIKRAYYNVVSDALETNFCFKGLKAGVALPILSSEATTSEVLKASIHLEKSIEAFYREAAELSGALLADVSRALDRVAKLRKSRVEALQTILEKEY